MGESDGSFSCKSAYNLLVQQRVDATSGDYKWIWRLKCPERIKLFIWLLFLDRLHTNDNRLLKQMTYDGSCSRCGDPLESAVHVMRDCSFATAVWNRWQGRGLLQDDFYSLSCADWLRKNCTSATAVFENVDWNCYFVITLWNLWRSRNNLIFHNKRDLAGDVWFRANKYAKEISMAYLSHITTVTEQLWVKWNKPAAGEFILNTDGARKHESSRASAGGLIRNDEGQWIKGFGINIGNTDSLFAELWGVREGLTLAKSLNISQLIVEVDATTVVQFLKKGVGSTHPCFTIVQDCRWLMQGHWVKEVRHIWRQGNQCADKLANLAQDYPPGVTILDNAPIDLNHLLLGDSL